MASEALLEEAFVPGEGEFYAYADGRVRAIFEDRTILHLNAVGSHCKVVLPDGHVVMVSVSQPVGVEAYVRAVLSFAAWAFKTREQRTEELNLQSRAQVRIVQHISCQRFKMHNSQCFSVSLLHRRS